MKLNTKIRRTLRWKYAVILVMTGIVLTGICLPCAAQTTVPDSVGNPVYDNLLIKAHKADTDSTLIGEAEEVVLDEQSARPLMDEPDGVTADNALGLDTLHIISGHPQTIYARPASWTYSCPWWHGMWINTAVYAGAFISTLFVLECLPEDATAWNRKEIQSRPFYTRWYDNVFKKGPEWDHDKFIFNYVLHPYAGAVYFMAARTCGFNFWQSFLYSACISSIGWEFGIEACMERPSYQDLVITPCVGSLIGEGFYRLKRKIVNNDYRVLGSPVLGHICAFFLDPVNEVVGLMSPPERCRTLGPGCISSQPLLIPSPGLGGSPAIGLSLTASF